MARTRQGMAKPGRAIAEGKMPNGSIGCWRIEAVIRL